jgi:hypothetical protein
MSISDLSAALQNLSSNPLFQMGVGTMAASGPSPVPVGLGQALGGGMNYAQQLAMKQSQAQMMRAQFQRFAWQNALLQKAFSGGKQGNGFQNPNFNQSLAPTAGSRASEASSSLPGAQTGAYGSQGFTPGVSATPLQIASQGVPALSQGGAQSLGVASPAQAAVPSGGPMQNGVLGSILGTPAGMASFALNPEGTMNFALSRQFGVPTPAMTNLQAAMASPQGSAARQMLMGQVMKSGAITTRNGALLPNGQFFQTPNLPDGVVLKDPLHPQAGVILPPGMAGAAAAMAGANAYPKEAAKAAYAYPIASAEEGARAQYTPQKIIGPNGVPAYVSQAAAIGAGSAGRPYQAGYTPEQQSQGQQFGEQNAQNFNAVQKAAQEAQMTSVGYQQALADAKTFQTGNFAEYKGKALAVLNGLGIQADPKGLASYQDMSKILTGAAMQTARTMGSREAAQIVNSIVKTASPNVGLSPQGFAQVVSFMQAGAYSKQAEAQAMQQWKNQGADLSNFQSVWNAANVPGQILFQRLTPQQQHDFAKSNPEAVKQLRIGYNVAAHYGWLNTLNSFQTGQ